MDHSPCVFFSSAIFVFLFSELISLISLFSSIFVLKEALKVVFLNKNSKFGLINFIIEHNMIEIITLKLLI